jgi:T6SS, Phospholipase effector Tle1-like, catalytic domain
VGVVRSKTLPLTDKTRHVCFFRHALALDERRVKYLPEYAHGGVSQLKDEQQNQDTTELDKARRSAGLSADEDKVKDTKPNIQASSSRPHIKEVWFPGTHSDMCVSTLCCFPF